jgi:adenine-specific DNA-methyltransferase
MYPDKDISGGFVYTKIPHVTLKSISNDEPIAGEILYDKPYLDKTKIRVTGPFTVEAIPSPVMCPVDLMDVSVNQTRKQSDWRDELRATGIIMRGGQKIEFSRVEPLSGTRYLQAEAETKEDTPRKVVVCFADETRPLDSRMVRMALDEAEKIRPSPKMVVFCAFQFDPAAAKDIDEVNWPGIALIKAQMNTDLLTEDLKKNRSSNQSFWAVGQPDVVCNKLEEGPDTGKYVIEVRGYDYYDMKNGMLSGEASDIAMWMLDVDYDGLSLNPAQIFFPMSESKDGLTKLAKTLRAEIDQNLIEAYRGTVSIPFIAEGNMRIAVKIVDNRGVESLKVMDIE